MANILPYLPLDTVEDVLLPFALESAAEAANTDGTTVRIFGGSGSGRIACGPGSFSDAQGRGTTLIPGYLIDFDFFLSEGEPVIAICCEFSNLFNHMGDFDDSARSMTLK